MSKTSNIETKPEHAIARPVPPPKTKLERTQSLLTVISTSIGLVGIAGSTFAFAASTFYTGSVDVRPDFDQPGIVVKVYTSEGHESVFHTKHLNLMPGQYHLEISSPNGRVVHCDTKVRFHHKNNIDVKLGPPPADSTISSSNTDSQPVRHGLDALVNFGAEPEHSIENGNPDTPNPSGNANTGVSTNSQVNSGSAEQHQAQSSASPTNSASVDNSLTAEEKREEASAAAKKRWWQLWKRGDKSNADSNSETKQTEN